MSSRTKPDPEVYLLISGKLDVPPNECLAIEDSPPGVQAALAAGVWCIAVTTDFTREAIHESKLLDEKWIVDDPRTLDDAFKRMIEEREKEWATGGLESFSGRFPACPGVPNAH